jgi:Caspase domain
MALPTFHVTAFQEGPMRSHQIIAAAWLALTCAAAAAHAEKRVALVVGNDRYANLPAHQQLQKAVNDAQAVGGALMQIGFDVISGENLDRRTLVRRLGEDGGLLALELHSCTCRRVSVDNQM